MKIYCCYTPAHAVLFREIFLPSVPSGFEVMATEIEISGPGDYLSAEFLDCIRKKIDLVVRSIDENEGQLIVWSDVDIRFFDLTPDLLGVEMLSSDCDLLFQRESPRMADVNTGFLVCRCCQEVREFFCRVGEQLGCSPGENEQMVVNRILLGKENGLRGRDDGTVLAESADPGASSEGRCTNEKIIAGDHHNDRGPGLSWGYLPREFYARTHGWPPPRKLALYHANYTKGADGMGQKLTQFSEIDWIRRRGLPAWCWSILRRIPGRFNLKA